MSINVHKTGLNKTLGQQSDAIVTTNLVGNWDPSLGINAGYWENQVSGGNHLRRFNGITHNNSTPHNFEFDGSDDYLGPAASGYGGTPFTLNVASAWTIATWVKYNDTEALPFYLDVGDKYIDPRLGLTGGVAVLTLTVRDVGYGSGDYVTFPFEFSGEYWYYIAIAYDGDKEYKMYINGSFNGVLQLDSTPDFSSGNPMTLQIGENQGYYNGDGTKVGHVHVYTAELTNSQLRQNFLATHKMHSDRIYGDTFRA